MEQHRIGFISTRFAGNDGVSLESAKWAQLLWDLGHISYWYGGRLDRAGDVSLCVPEAHFNHPANQWINERILGQTRRPRSVTRRIHELASYLKDSLYRFVERFDIDVLILQNVVSIPMHVPLGIAVTEFIAESRLPTIAHHHDFYWERVRFQNTAVGDYLDMAFPPRLRGIQHVVINQRQREELSWRKGIPSNLIPNILDFETPPPPVDDYSAALRREIGIGPDDVLILQPTRVVPRKGIEHAIKLAAALGSTRHKLVISHEAGDEGLVYLEVLKELAGEAGVDVRFIADRIGDVRQRDLEGRKIYTLWDLYPHADLVTFFSGYEGFGNALLEAIYFKVPVVTNRYEVFTLDIEPKGFRIPAIENVLTRRVIDEVRRLLEDEDHRREAVEHNHAIAGKFFSYSVARRKLAMLITNIMGE